MAKEKEPTVAELKAQIESLQQQLNFEKDINRKILGLPEDTPSDEITPTWSTKWMQEQMDQHEVTDGAVTRAYNELVFKLIRLRNGNVIIKRHDGKLARRDGQRHYKKFKVVLSQEAFFMMLELMKFAEREFDLNQRDIVDTMTGGEGIKVQRSINGF